VISNNTRKQDPGDPPEAVSADQGAYRLNPHGRSFIATLSRLIGALLNRSVNKFLQAIETIRVAAAVLKRAQNVH